MGKMSSSHSQFYHRRSIRLTGVAAVIGWFKTMTTNEYIRGVNNWVGENLIRDYGSVIILK